jgi:hypothetical protein
VSGVVDWRALAERLGAITWTESGRSESGGTKVARQALIDLLGEEALLSAVEHYLAFEPGAEVARSVLWELRPPVAMDRCLAVFRADPDIERVRAAVQLLKWVADARAIEWYPEFAAHEDVGVRIWAVGVIDQLWMIGEIEPEHAIEQLQTSLEDETEKVRSQAERVVEMIREDIAFNAKRLDEN